MGRKFEHINNMYQEDSEIKIIRPNNLGWIEAKLPEESMKRLWSYIERDGNLKNNEYNYNLAGNISKEFILIDTDNWFAKEILSTLCNIYTKEFGNLASETPIWEWDKEFDSMKLNEMWCNYQYKHEFNPLHIHKSCMYSFSVWMKIPTDWREQHKLNFTKESTMPCASDFSFTYTNILGGITNENYYLDKSMEGTILFFPSQLMHQVYPFYGTDEPRISVAGNIGLARSNTEQ
jgi:hypothetical protein